MAGFIFAATTTVACWACTKEAKKTVAADMTIFDRKNFLIFIAVRN
jgi:hypothetical protein